MKKEYYVIESRKMKKIGKLIPNETAHVIGIFTNPVKAENWIKKNGRSYFTTDKQLKVDTKQDAARFWAVLVGHINTGELILHHFYNLDGNTIDVGSLEYHGE